MSHLHQSTPLSRIATTNNWSGPQRAHSKRCTAFGLSGNVAPNSEACFLGIDLAPAIVRSIAKHRLTTLVEGAAGHTVAAMQ